MADIITIGIAGGTGSGKTTITRTLQDRFSHHVSVIYHDNYYHAHDDMTYEERSRLNYDAPEAFDTQRLIRDLKALRRILRDVKERGRSLESVVNQYLTTVKPMHEMYVEPSKRSADIIIPEGGHNLVAMEMLIQRVNAHLNAQMNKI